MIALVLKLSSFLHYRSSHRDNISLFLVTGILLLGVYSSTHSASALLAGACNCVIFRLDDIQDWWLNSVQIEAMNQFTSRQEKLSVGLVMNFVGNDASVVDKVKAGHNAGTIELVSHGWNHVDYQGLTYQQQFDTLGMANEKIASLWGRSTVLFIPPYNSFDNDTLRALKDLNMKLISSEFDNLAPFVQQNQVFKSQTNSNIKDNFGLYELPQEVGYWNYDNDVPVKNSLNLIMTHITNRINSHGYAVVTLHPQDFALKVNNVPINQVDSKEMTDINTLIDLIHTAGYTIKSYSDVAKIALPPVVDNTPPVLTPPTDISFISSGVLTIIPGGLGNPIVTDNVDPFPILSNDAPVGGFPQGTTTVTWNATDHAGNTRLATQYVTIRPNVDSVKPAVTISTPISGSINGPAAGLNILVTGTSSDAQSGIKMVEIRTDSLAYSNAAPSSSNSWSSWSKTLRFTSSGTTTIVARSTDFWGNQQWATTPVTITLGGPDVTAPQITPPPNITTEATASLTPVSIGRATAFDNSDLVPVVTSNAPGAGESAGFPLGTSTITWTAKDSAGNIATAIQTITIVDTIAPPTPTTLSPANGSQIASGTMTFDWTDSIDEVSDASYDLRVANNSQFSNPLVQQSGLTQSNFTSNIPLPTSTYYWKVRSSDASGNASPFSNPSMFAVDNGDPVVSATPKGGVFNTVQSIVLTSSIPGSAIYYTTDGSTPTASSTLYTSAVPIVQTTDLKFFAVSNLGSPGPQVTESFIIDMAAPSVVASPPGGSYNTVQSIALTANESALIYYTTDGSTPTISSTIYTSPISISVNTVLKFFAKDAAGNTSQVVTETYTADIISFPVTQMSDTTQTYGLAMYGPSSQTNSIAHIEFASPTSQLVGKSIDQITLKLRKMGLPTGTAEIGIFNADLTVKKLFGTKDAASIASVYTDYSFSLPNNVLYTIASGDRIGIKYTAGNSANFVAVMIDRDSSDPFDGNNSYRHQYNAGWLSYLPDDIYMVLKQTHG